MSSSTSSREGDNDPRSAARSTATSIQSQTSASISRPRTVYDEYHGDDSENEVEEELREREHDYGFRASSKSECFFIIDDIPFSVPANGRV
jgi:hypothetical protein